MQRNITDEEFLEAASAGDERTVRSYLESPDRNNQVIVQGLRLAVDNENFDIQRSIIVYVPYLAEFCSSDPDLIGMVHSWNFIIDGGEYISAVDMLRAMSVSHEEFLVAAREGDTVKVSSYLGGCHRRPDIIQQGLQSALAHGQQVIGRLIMDAVRPAERNMPDRPAIPLGRRILNQGDSLTERTTPPAPVRRLQSDSSEPNYLLFWGSSVQSRQPLTRIYPSHDMAYHVNPMLGTLSSGGLSQMLRNSGILDRANATEIDNESIRELLAAARNNSREFIESYISDHHDEPGFVVHLRTAAQLAEAEGHDGLAAYMSQIITDFHRSQEGRRESGPPQSEEVIYNRNEVRLMEVNYTGDIPDELCCPVTGGIMEDPVTVSSGYTYEREALVKLMGNSNSCLCPCTRLEINQSELKNAGNVSLLSYIENFVRMQEDPKHVWECASILKCPLTNKLYEDPVTLACGLTFDRAALKALFEEKNNPAKILWQDKYPLKLSEVNDTASNVTIKTLLERYQDELNKKLKSSEQRDVSSSKKESNADQSGSRLFGSPQNQGSKEDQKKSSTPSSSGKKA